MVQDFIVNKEVLHLSLHFIFKSLWNIHETHHSHLVV